jgi:hypothetical protein
VAKGAGVVVEGAGHPAQVVEHPVVGDEVVGAAKLHHRGRKVVVLVQLDRALEVGLRLGHGRRRLGPGGEGDQREQGGEADGESVLHGL